jgi:hypothetical protein
VVWGLFRGLVFPGLILYIPLFLTESGLQVTEVFLVTRLQEKRETLFIGRLRSWWEISEYKPIESISAL